jgi:serine/threonine protein kinase
MNQVCLRCAREGPLGSLWCQETACAADDKPPALEAGDTLGDMLIARRVAVLRTGGLYEAERLGRPVLLKAAHPGLGLGDRLAREATFLAEARRRGVRHPALPVLLPAYPGADVGRYPFGAATAHGQAFNYCVFDHSPGELLQFALLQDPQPWYQHAGWIVLAVADAVALMHTASRLHLCLSPESILVRRDRLGQPRPMLIDLGVAAPPDQAGQQWHPRLAQPGYVAPELLGHAPNRFGAQADVYGLGLLLYEMLGGRPAFPRDNQIDATVHARVLSAAPAPLVRPDLRDLPQIAAQAIARDPASRPPYAIHFAGSLQRLLPPVPPEPRERSVNWRTVAVVLAAAMAVALLLVFAWSVGQSLS